VSFISYSLKVADSCSPKKKLVNLGELCLNYLKRKLSRDIS